MYSVIIDNNMEKKSSKRNDIKINFGRVYFFLVLVIGSIIYFYSVYQNNYLTILISYKILWPILIILIGISMLRVRNKGAFSLALFITILSVGMTITSIFVYSSSIKNNIYNIEFPIKDFKELAFDINLTASKTKISSENIDFFKSNFVSNYDTLISNNYMDENKVENVKLEQNIFPPGIGAYTKDSNMIFPTNIPIELKLNSNLSIMDINLTDIKLKSGYIKINNSILDMVIENTDIVEDVVLDINSNLSRLNIVISKDIPITISNSSSLSQTNFIGIEKTADESNIYQTVVQESIPNQTSYSDEIFEIEPNTETEKEIKESKKLIINLKSTLSQVNVTQK